MITLKHILVPTDFSECSAAAVEQGGALAAAFDASLHLVHVAIAPLHEPWAGEAPGEQFVGTHGRRGWDHLLMGSVAERVVRLAPCPVLTAHASPAAARKALQDASGIAV